MWYEFVRRSWEEEGHWTSPDPRCGTRGPGRGQGRAEGGLEKA